MFRSRKKSRRQNRSNRSRSAKLRVELMEGRMMLSGTDVAPVQPTLDLTQHSIVPAQYSLTSAWFSVAEQPSDGGYSNVFGFSGIDPAVHLDVLSAADAVVAYGAHGPSVAGLVRSNSFNSGIAFDHADSYSDSQPFQVLYGLPGTTLIEGGGLIGQAIDAAPILSRSDSAVINLQPVVLGPVSSPSSSPSPGTAAVPEGGSISIHAIFADFRQDSHLASGVKAISRAGETSVDSLASARQLSVPDGAIAGEWARAMVFEIAGGEPTTGDSHSLDGEPTTTSDSNKALQHSKPLSSVESLQQYGKLAGHQAQTPANEGPPVGEPGKAESMQPSGLVAAIEAQLAADGKLLADLTTPADDDQFSDRDPSGTENGNTGALATAGVFDQLGQANASVFESTVYGKSWLRSIGTSPLLMLLALERIAALNSRRATRESRIAAAKKPRRLHG